MSDQSNATSAEESRTNHFAISQHTVSLFCQRFPMKPDDKRKHQNTKTRNQPLNSQNTMKTIANHASAGILTVLLLIAGAGQASAQVTTNIGINSWANDVMSGYDSGSWVVNGTQFDPFVGNINNLPGYTRLLLKFDISGITGDVEQALFNITSFAAMGNNTVQLSSYNSSETSASFTSADIASSLGNSTPIDTFGVVNTDGNVALAVHWNLDITTAVQTAKANNYTYASFLLYSLTANAIQAAPFDSYVFFLAKNGGQGIYDPNIIVTTAIPEPSTYALVLGGIATLLLIRRRVQS
jgi:hypothetical protein